MKTDRENALTEVRWLIRTRQSVKQVEYLDGASQKELAARYVIGLQRQDHPPGSWGEQKIRSALRHEGPSG